MEKEENIFKSPIKTFIPHSPLKKKNFQMNL